MLTWTIQVSVDPSWIEDGFNPDEEQFKSAISEMIPFAHGNELLVKITKRPNPDIIKRLQA